MIDTQSIKEFRLIFLLTCLVALTPINDYRVVTNELHMTDVDARKKLEQYVALRETTVEKFSSRCDDDTMETGEKLSKPEMRQTEKVTITHQWIKDIISSVTPTAPDSMPGENGNLFYLPELICDLERIGKEFPLWTGAAVPNGCEHASTASQEGHFADLRHRMCEHINLPCSGNRFLRTHLDDILSGNNLMASKLKSYNQQKQPSDVEKEGKSEKDNHKDDADTATYNDQPTRMTSPALSCTVHKELSDEFKRKLEKKPLARERDDSDFLSRMEWRGIINPEAHNFWYEEDTQTIYTEEVTSSEVLIETRESQDGHDKSNDKMSTKADGNNNENAMWGDLGPLDTSESSDGLGSPAFSSTINPDHSYAAFPAVDTTAYGIPVEDPPSMMPHKKTRNTYFQPYPQKAVLNEREGRTGKGFLLPYGGFSGVVKYNGMKILLSHTCGFDCLVHLIEFVALEDMSYRQMIKNSPNPFFQLIDDLLQSGINSSIFLQ